MSGERISEDRLEEIRRQVTSDIVMKIVDLIKDGYTLNEASTYFTYLNEQAGEAAFDIRSNPGEWKVANDD